MSTRILLVARHGQATQGPDHVWTPDDPLTELGHRQAADLATHVAGLVESLGLPTRLSLVGVPEEGIPALVDGAMGDGCTLLNPRDPSEEDFAGLFQAAL